MILFFDTETTGFPHRHKPIHHEDQPHIVQLAAQLTDEVGRVVSGFNFIIDPGVERGVRIPSSAAAIHGIDEETCWRLGVELARAIDAFWHLAERADEFVAHNIAFDDDIMQTAFARLKRDADAINFLAQPRFCTMKEATEVCKIPSPKGGYKWPRLTECIKHFFNEDMEGAHDAMNDVNACKRVFFHLRSLEGTKA